MVHRLGLLIALFVTPLYSQAGEIDWVKGFVVAFPQVVKGPIGETSVETILVLSNPSTDPATVQLTASADLALPGSASLELSSRETRQIIFAGAPFQSGWVELAASAPVAAAAYISAKRMKRIRGCSTDWRS